MKKILKVRTIFTQFYVNYTIYQQVYLNADFMTTGFTYKYLQTG